MTEQLQLRPSDVVGMSDSKYMTAAEKRKVLRQWHRFLQGGCIRDDFTGALYEHLIMNCSFIAHYDRNGFWGTYFSESEDTIHFLSQFDDRNGIPRSIEYGMTGWYTAHDYHDINSAMCQTAGRYIPELSEVLQRRQAEKDISRAALLLAKHGIKFTNNE